MVFPPAPSTKRELPTLAYFLLIPCVTLGFVVAIFFTLLALGYIQPFQVPSSGMAPFLCRRDMVITEAITLAFRGIRRGDVAIFDSGEVPSLRAIPRFTRLWANRVIALPGDRFQLKNSQVWINGTLAPEFKDHQYTALPTTLDGLDLTKEALVPEGQCLMLGDNTNNSLDSRYWGFLPVKSVKYVYAFHYYKSSDRSLKPWPSDESIHPRH